MIRKSKRAKACDITPQVRREVSERDGGICILCGKLGEPNAHFIPRSAGGLGVAENIVTLCYGCHTRYDQTPERPYIREFLRGYLKSKYPGWVEKALYYTKYGKEENK